MTLNDNERFWMKVWVIASVVTAIATGINLLLLL